MDTSLPTRAAEVGNNYWLLERGALCAHDAEALADIDNALALLLFGSRKRRSRLIRVKSKRALLR